MKRSVIAKRLTKYLLLTLLISSVLGFLGLNVFYMDEGGHLEKNQYIIIVEIMNVCWAFILFLCSLTVYLNLYAGIRNNRVYCMLTFFLLPVSVILVAFSLGAFEELWQSFAITSGFFIITHLFFYIRFLKGSHNVSRNTEA